MAFCNRPYCVPSIAPCQRWDTLSAPSLHLASATIRINQPGKRSARQGDGERGSLIQPACNDDFALV